MNERSRELNAKIAALESKIKSLNEQARKAESGDGRFRSTAYPHDKVAAKPKPPPDPVFEKVDRDPLKLEAEPNDELKRYNELGLRKYDLVSAWKRLKEQWRGPEAPNPKLVNYLASGTVQGLRPLRYEKRVARRRFFGLVTVLLLTLLGIALWVGNRR